MLLRALFPSWKFFDEVGFIHELMVRVRTADTTFGAWQPAPYFPRRNPFSLFLYSKGNFRHAENSLVEALVHKLRDQDAKDIQSWPLYEMVRILAQERAKAVTAQATHYQFALMLKRIGEEDRTLEETLLSPEYELSHG